MTRNYIFANGKIKTPVKQKIWYGYKMEEASIGPQSPAIHNYLVSSLEPSPFTLKSMISLPWESSDMEPLMPLSHFIEYLERLLLGSWGRSV